jgi:hypothetical protein
VHVFPHVLQEVRMTFAISESPQASERAVRRRAAEPPGAAGFAEKAMEANKAEVQLGELAQQKG